MIFHIARKEFLNNLLTARFLIGFLLCLVLIPFSILLSVSDYRDQSALYRQDRDAADKGRQGGLCLLRSAADDRPAPRAAERFQPRHPVASR